MKKSRKKTRSVASYRAASLKGARVKRRMREAKTLTDYFVGVALDAIEEKERTIDLIPKVKWP